jgi:hypothetical protein
MDAEFWKKLESYKDFKNSFNLESYTLFCPSWHLFIADIQGSTKAIKEGRYKDVNLIGAMSIVAVINACKEIEIPFVFGGDGASILVPDTYVQKTKDALLATKERALEHFGLHLRVGSISVKELNSKNISLYVAKHEISKDYKQAIFHGGGISQADTLIKNNPSYCYDLPETINAVDFSGLECRWKDIPSSKEETISLLIYSNEAEHYQNLLEYISLHLGNYSQRSPVQINSLGLSFSFSQLSHEANAKSSGFKKYFFLIGIWFVNLFALFLIKFNIKLNKTQWGKYKQQITLTTDSEKFDDMLRMTCSVNTKERQQLEKYLHKQFLEKKLCYGIHVSNRALMTCLVFERMGAQVHFVDTADGGYAMAAIGIKKQLQGF